MPVRNHVILSEANDLDAARSDRLNAKGSFAALSMTLFMVFVAFPLRAQEKVATIDPGMTRAQVVARLGEPLSSRSFENYTYMLFKNGCEKKCGMNDLVVLDSGKVVDAVFRSPARKYAGTSSSPRMIPQAEANRGAAKPADAAPKPLTVKKPAH